MFAKKQGRGAVPATVMGGHDAATGRALRGDELRNHVDGKRRLVAQGDERAVERAGKLLQGGHADPNRRSHALGPRGIVRDEHRMAGEHRADFFGMGAQHHDDGPRGRGEGGFDGAEHQRLAVDDEQLLWRAHPRGFPGRQDHGAETERIQGRRRRLSARFHRWFPSRARSKVSRIT